LPYPERAARLSTGAPKQQQRRRRTGRNVQFNIRATPEAIERFIAISDRQGWVFVETLDHALTALEQSLARKSE
jgi:hypothetical protein